MLSDNFIRTYPKSQSGPAFKSTTTVRHNGTIIAFAVRTDRRIVYSVLDLGDQRTKGPIDVNYWSDNPRDLRFPNEVVTVGEGLIDPKEMPVFKIGGRAPVTDGSRVKENEKDLFRSTTASLSADAPIQAWSDNKYVYIFRQSVANARVGVAADTLLVDRFILSGTVLKPKREVRYQRSRNKFRPQSRKDGLAANDLEKRPFFEPTQKLEFIRSLKAGRFTALILPTQVTGIQRWQLFAYNNKTGSIDSFSIERSSDGLFNLQGSQAFSCPEHSNVFQMTGGACPEPDKNDPGKNCPLELVRIPSKEGYAEWALQFDGNETSISLPSQLPQAALDDLVIEFWLKPGGFGTPQTLLASGSKQVGALFIDAQGQLVFNYAPGATGQGPQVFASAIPLAANKWSHVALSIASKARRAEWHINGQLANSETDLTGLTPPAGKLNLGSGAPGHFSGLLDELRIWTRPRSGEEIAESMRHRLMGFEPGLFLYWRLDEGRGETVHDMTENAHHGKVAGTPVWVESDAPVGDHPGVRRSSFAFDNRKVVTGMSALLYYHQEQNKSGYDGKDKPLKTKARVMLATATRPDPNVAEAKNHIAVLDFGVTRAGKLAQVPDTIKLQPVESTGQKIRSSRAIQQDIVYWEQIEAERAKLVEELKGNLDLPPEQPFVDAGFRRLPSQEQAEEIVLVRDRAIIEVEENAVSFQETGDDTSPEVLSMASWAYESGTVAEFVKTTETVTVTVVEEIPDDEPAEGEEPTPPPPAVKIVGTPEWLQEWTAWENDAGAGEAALVSGQRFFYFKGDKYQVFDWAAREFGEPTKIADGLFTGLWPEGIDAAYALEDNSVIFLKGLLYKQYTPQARGGFKKKAEGNINDLYPGIPFLFLHPEFNGQIPDLADMEESLNAAKAELSKLAGELARSQEAELKNLEIEVEMHLVHKDPFGHSTLGGLLTFAWSQSTPALFDSANGKLALYFQGEADQFFVAYYDTMTSAVNLQVPAGGASEVAFIPRIVAPMDKAVIKISGNDSEVCDVSLQHEQLDIYESWQNVPRTSQKFAGVLNGVAQPIPVGELEKDIENEITFVELVNIASQPLQHGRTLVVNSRGSIIKRVTQQVALSFKGTENYVELPQPLSASAGTVAIWLRFNGSSNQTICDASAQENGAVPGKAFTLDIRNGKLRFTLENDAQVSFVAKTDLAPLSVGTDWHHLAVTWDFESTNSMHMFLDGIEVAEEDNLSGGYPEYLNPFVGAPRGVYFAKGHFRGEVAEICVHSTSQSLGQIAVANAAGIFGSAPESAGGCWRFQEVDGSPVALDYSANKLHASLQGPAVLLPIGSGSTRVDIEAITLMERVAAGTPVYAVLEYAVNGTFDEDGPAKRSMLFAADASKAHGKVENATVFGSAANSPMTSWIAYAQGSTLEFSGQKGSVATPPRAKIASFDAEGDTTVEAWVRPEPMQGNRFSRVVHHNSAESLYLLGFKPTPLQSAMYFNATESDKAYTWAASQSWNPILGRHWAFEAARAAVRTAGSNGTDKQIADAARRAAQDAINPGFFFLIFWGYYERERVGDLAYDWALSWAAGHKDYVQCKNSAALNPKSDQWTVELWFKADKTSEENILYNKEQLFEAQVHDGFFEYAWQPSWKWQKTFPVAKGRWYHAAVVYDGKTQKVYRNGQFFSQRTQTGKINNNTFPLLIGARYIGAIRNGVSRHFKGAIDEVRVWGEARTADQILNNVHKRLRGDERHLRGYWHFEENLARDFTPNENHGLLKGSPDTVASTMPGYAATAGIGSKIEGTFSDTYIQSKEAIPYFDWNHLAAVYRASYGLRFSEQGAFVDCGDSASLDLSGDLTIEIFLRLDNLTQPRALLGKGTAVPAYSVYVNLQGRLVFSFQDESGDEQTFVSAAHSALRVGRFYRIAVVRRHQSKTRDVQKTRRVDGKNVTVNVPEVEEWDDIEIHICEWKTDRYARRIGLAQKYGGPKPRENGENLIIGRASPRNSAPFKGVIGEVRVWNRGLGQLETCQNIIGIESGLVSWWRFDENEGYASDDVTGTNPAALNLVDWVRNPDPLASSFGLFNNGVALETHQVPKPATARLKKGFAIGPMEQEYSDAFRGTVEELRVWRTARTQEQIQDNMFLRLIGEKEDLIAYYTFDQSADDELKDLSFRGNHLPVKDATFVVSDAPIGHDVFQVRNALLGVKTAFHDRIQGQPGVQEYGDMQFDSEGNLIGVLKRCYSFIKDGQWYLVTGFKVGNLLTEWIGQVQFNPELKGVVEGAPPVPSENLSAGPVDPSQGDYTGVTSVEVVEAENVTYTYSTSKEAGLNASFGLSAKFGVDTSVLLIVAPLGFGTATELSDVNVLVGLEGKFDAAAGWSSENTVGVGRNLTKSTKVTLGGAWEDPTKPLNKALHRRYQPANMGFALVQSETADVFALRLEHNMALVSFQFRPNPDIPKDWNIIPFAINPRYTKQGTLDGAVGYDERGKVLDPDYPNARDYGQHSYFKPKEAYSLKNRITKEEQELINYFRSVDTKLGGAPDLAISAGLGLIEGASEGGAPGAIEGLVDALGSSGLPEKIGKQNLVNTYVWTADGGFFAETTEVMSMKQETTAGSFSFSGEVGAVVGVDFSVASVDVSLGFSAMLGGSLNLSKSKNKESQNAFALNIAVDVPGDLQAYDENLNRIYDRDGNPVALPGKVDAYRFMTFYLEPSTENFDTFFNQVVDPIWLQSNHPNALALQQAQQSGKKPPCWRVLHRVTFVSRILPEIPDASAPPLEKNMKVANVESNWQLIQKLDPFVRNKVSDPARFRQAVRDAVETYLPALAQNTEEIIQFLSAYYQVFEEA